ncbi:MAG: heparinase II/III domain-containing protein [Limisphaerales bacterium]
MKLFLCEWRLVEAMRLRLLLALLFSVRCLAAEPVTVPVAVPESSAVLKTLRHEHPRLLANAADFERLKQGVQTNETLKGWYGNVQHRANAILNEAPSKYEIPDGLRLLATSRRVVNRMYDLGMMYRLTGEKKFAERAWAELKAAGEFKDWNSRHFLDTAEMTHGFGIGYDWFYDYWTPEQRTFLRRAIVEKGLNLALGLHRRHGTWTHMTHNWNQVCNGGTGMGALAIGDEEPAVCGELLHDALESIQLAMVKFAPDGAWNEGPGYWNYATIYNVTFLAGLESALGTDFGLSQIAGFSNCGLFPIYMTAPNGHIFDFADCHDGRDGDMPQLFWLSKKFDRPEYAAFGQQYAAGSAQDIIWASDAPRAEPVRQRALPSGLPLDKYFRAAEVATFRSDWKDPNGVCVSFKAGSNRANHAHLDIGSFVLDALGERWALDLGSDDYNLPAYFGGNRWTYYRLRAEGHNTLLLDPADGPDQNSKADTRIVRFESKPERVFAIADITTAYTNASKVLRGIMLLNRRDVVIEDEIEKKQSGNVWWFLHTAAAIHAKGSEAVLELNGKKLFARILSPANAKFEAMQPEPLPTSPHPPVQAKNNGVTKLAIHMPGMARVRLAILLSPEPTQRPEVMPLDRW